MKGMMLLSPIILLSRLVIDILVMDYYKLNKSAITIILFNIRNLYGALIILILLS